MRYLRKPSESCDTSQRPQSLQQRPGQPSGTLRELPHEPTQTGVLGCNQERGGTPEEQRASGLGEVNGLVSSPPYTASLASDDPDKRGGLFRDPKRRNDKTLTAEYGQSDGQLGAMREGDFEGMVTSPPYEEGGGHRSGQADRDIEAGKGIYTPCDHYGDAHGNLGNERGDTFWSAARTIIEQTHQTLAPDAVAVWVCKSFVRKKARVDFPGQWRELCEACGFETIEMIRAWLVEDRGAQYTLTGELDERTIERKSFFRRLAESKGSPRIDYEVVIIQRRI